MKSIVLGLALLTMGTLASADQTLQAAGVFNPKIQIMVDAIEKSAGVECLDMDSKVSRKIAGPDGKTATTQQAACYDPNAFNPNQLGQIFVTYYGEGKDATSPVGDVIEIQFEVFK